MTIFNVCWHLSRRYPYVHIGLRWPYRKKNIQSIVEIRWNQCYSRFWGLCSNYRQLDERQALKNSSKTEFILLGSKMHLEKCTTRAINTYENDIKLKCIRYLGAWKHKFQRISTNMPYSYAKLSKDQMYSIVFNERSNGNFSLVLSHFSRHLQLFCGSSTGVSITRELCRNKQQIINYVLP